MVRTATSIIEQDIQKREKRPFIRDHAGLFFERDMQVKSTIKMPIMKHMNIDTNIPVSKRVTKLPKV